MYTEKEKKFLKALKVQGYSKEESFGSLERMRAKNANTSTSQVATTPTKTTTTPQAKTTPDYENITKGSLAVGATRLSGSAGDTALKTVGLFEKLYGVAGEYTSYGLGNIAGFFGNEGKERAFDQVGEELRSRTDYGAKIISDFGTKVSATNAKMGEQAKENILKDDEAYKRYKQKQASGYYDKLSPEKIDEDLLAYGMYGGLLENAPTMAMSIAGGSGVVKYAGGNLVKALAGTTVLTAGSLSSDASIESASQYNQAIDEGHTEEEALTRAGRVYSRNMIGNSVSEFIQMSLLQNVMNKAGGGASGKFLQMLSAGVIEAGQERGQDSIQEQSGDEKFDFKKLTEKMKARGISESDLIAFTLGFGTVGGGNIVVKGQEGYGKLIDKYNNSGAFKEGVETAQKVVTGTANRLAKPILNKIPESIKSKFEGKDDVTLLDKISAENPEVVKQASEEVKEDVQVLKTSLEAKKVKNTETEKAKSLLEKGASKQEVELALSEKLDEETSAEVIDSLDFGGLDQELAEEMISGGMSFEDTQAQLSETLGAEKATEIVNKAVEKFKNEAGVKPTKVVAPLDSAVNRVFKEEKAVVKKADPKKAKGGTKKTPIEKNESEKRHSVGDTVSFHKIENGEVIGLKSKKWKVKSAFDDKLILVDKDGNKMGTSQSDVEKAPKKETQKDKVEKVVKEAGITNIKEVKKALPDLPEPTIRRILGQGAKDGTFKRVDNGVYTLTKGDQELAYIEVGSAMEVLPRLAKEGFKSDMIFLDIPYDTPAVKGGSRGVKYNLVSVEQFSKVLDAVKVIARDVNTPIIHMYSQAKSGLKEMNRYNELFIEKGLNIVGKGDYTKMTKGGKQFGFPTSKGWRPLNPEGILVFTESGELKKDLKNLNFKLVRPRGYQTEKPKQLLKELIEMTTEEGDVVLDPFAGSGVTIAEAVRAGRKGAGIEINENAVEEHIKPKVEEASKEVKTSKKEGDYFHLGELVDSNDVYDVFKYKDDVSEISYAINKKEDFINLSNIEVRKSSQRKGIGSSLVKNLIKFADKKKLDIRLLPADTILDKFYRKLGFEYTSDKQEDGNYYMWRMFKKKENNDKKGRNADPTFIENSEVEKLAKEFFLLNGVYGYSDTEFYDFLTKEKLEFPNAEIPEVTEKVIKELKEQEKRDDEEVYGKVKNKYVKKESETKEKEISVEGIIITAEEIESSYQNLSFRSGQGVQEIAELHNEKEVELKRLEEFFAQVKEPQIEKKELEEQFSRYWEGRLKREKALIGARSRTASSAITGAGNFPVAKNRKAMNTYMNRVQDIIDFKSRVLGSIQKKIKGSDVIKSSDSDVVTKLETKLSSLKENHEKMKEGNAIIRKYKGNIEKTKEELLKIGLEEDSFNFNRADGSFMNFFLTNSNAKIKNTEKRLSVIKKNKEVTQGGNLDYSFEGGKVVFNGDIMRIQVLFDEKPNETVRANLKKNSFRWSPKNSAWQRTLNNQGAYLVRSMFEKKEIKKESTLPEIDQEILAKLDQHVEILADSGVDIVPTEDGKGKRVSKTGDLTLSRVMSVSTTYKRLQEGIKNFYKNLENSSSIEEALELLGKKDRQILDDLLLYTDKDRFKKETPTPKNQNSNEDLFRVWGESKNDGSWGVKKPAIKKSNVVITNNNQDVGEKIGGAKKDLWASEREKILSEISDKDIMNTPTAKLVPIFDYKKLLDSGKNEDYVKLYVMLRGQLGSKPRRYGVKGWVEDVKGLRLLGAEMLKSNLNSPLEKTPEMDITFELFDRYDYLNDKDIQKTSVKRIESFYDEVTNTSKKEYVMNFNGKAYSGFYKILAETNDGFFSKFNDKFENFGLHKEHKKKDEGRKKKKPFKDFLAVYRIKKTGEYVIFYKNGSKEFQFSDVFKTAVEARKARQDVSKIKEWEKIYTEATNFDKNSFRIQDSTAHRTDKYRTGNVTSEQFMEDFGFRGVEFGNWVNQEERQVRLNSAYDSFMELANIISIPPKALSLNGELAFAFGSRGKRGASAHYESGKVVINLTKKNGAGTVAHEWFHSMDNYLMRKQGHKSLFATGSKSKRGVSEQYSRKEVADAFKNLMNTLYKETDIYKRSERADKIQGKRYYAIPTEMGARAFESYIKDKLDKENIDNKFLVSLERVENISDKILESYPYALGEEEINKVSKAMEELFIDALKVEDPEGKAILYKLKAKEIEEKYTKDFLVDVKKRLNLDFDVEFVDTILSKGDKAILGATYDNTIALKKGQEFTTTALHEIVHLTVNNLDKINAFENFDKKGIFDAIEKSYNQRDFELMAKKMGIEYTAETADQVKEELLAYGVEKYYKDRIAPTNNILKRFYRAMRKMIKRLARAIKLSEGSIVEDYYETLIFAEDTSKNFVRLKNEGILKSFVSENSLHIEEDAVKHKRYSGKVSSMEEARDNMQRRYDNADSLSVRNSLDSKITKLNESIRKRKSKEDLAGVMFKLADEKNLKNLKGKFNDVVKQEVKAEKLIVEYNKQIAELIIGREDTRGAQEALKSFFKVDRMRYQKGGKAGQFTEKGIATIKEMSETVENVEGKIQEFVQMRAESETIQSQILELKKKVSSLKRGQPETEKEKREIRRRMLFISNRIKVLKRKIKQARKFGRGYNDNKNNNHKKRLAEEIINLSKVARITDTELVAKILETERIDFNEMTEDDFFDFIDELIKVSDRAVNKEFLKQSINDTIMRKKFKYVDNLRKSLSYKTRTGKTQKFPTLNKMTEKQLGIFKEKLAEFKEGDAFVTPRFKEASGFFSKKPISTYRELRDVYDIDPKEVTNKKYQTALGGGHLAKLSPFHNLLAKFKLIALNKADHNHNIKADVIAELMHKARKSRARKEGVVHRIKNEITPKDEHLAKYIRMTPKERIEATSGETSEFTLEEVEAGNWLVSDYKSHLEYLKLWHNQKSRFDSMYMPHKQKGVLQYIIHDGDIKKAVRSIFLAQEREEAIAKIIPDTKSILAYEKFFGNMMKRGNEIDPSLDVLDTWRAYDSVIEKKKELDKYVPFVVGIAKLGDMAQPKTKEGVPMDSIQAFTKEFLNDAKGRKANTRYMRQGGKLSRFIDMNMFMTTFWFIWGNIGLNIANFGGAVVGAGANLTDKQKVKNFYDNFVKIFGNNKAWEYLIGTVSETPIRNFKQSNRTLLDAIKMTGFIGMSYSRVLGERMMIAMSLTKEEFNNIEQIEKEKLADIMLELSQSLPIKHTKSVIGNTDDVKIVKQWKDWAIPFVIGHIMHDLSIVKKSSMKLVGKKENELTKDEKKHIVRNVVMMSNVAVLYGLLKMLPDCDEGEKTMYCYVMKKLKRDIMLPVEAIKAMNPFENDISGVAEISLNSIAPMTILYEKFMTYAMLVIEGEDYEKTDTSKAEIYRKKNLPQIIMQFVDRDKLKMDTASVKNRLIKGVDSGENDIDELARYMVSSTKGDFSDLSNEDKQVYRKKAEVSVELYKQIKDDENFERLWQYLAGGSRTINNYVKAGALVGSYETVKKLKENTNLCEGWSESRNRPKNCVISDNLMKEIEDRKTNG